MNRRNFLKAAGLALGASLLPRDIGARDSYEPTPEHVEVSEFWDRDHMVTEDSRRRFWSLDPGRRDDAYTTTFQGGRGARTLVNYFDEATYQEDVDNYRMLLDENRQRQFASWVESTEPHETKFTDWVSESRNSPYYQTHIMTGQSYAPIMGVQSIGYAAQSKIISHATAKRMIRFYDED